MQFLLERDLKAFRPWKEQQSFAADSALTKQKQLSLSAPLAWLQEVIDSVLGQGLPAITIRRTACLTATDPHASGCRWPSSFPRNEAVNAFRGWTNKAKPYGASEYTGSPERFWSEICKVIPRGQTSRQAGGGIRLVKIDLADLQNNFEKYLKGEIV